MLIPISIFAEAATGGVLQEKVSLEISQNLQENTCVRVSFLIELQGSGKGFFLWILRNFYKDIFFTVDLWVTASEKSFVIYAAENLEYVLKRRKRRSKIWTNSFSRTCLWINLFNIFKRQLEAHP